MVLSFQLLQELALIRESIRERDEVIRERDEVIRELHTDNARTTDELDHAKLVSGQLFLELLVAAFDLMKAEPSFYGTKLHVPGILAPRSGRVSVRETFDHVTGQIVGHWQRLVSQVCPHAIGGINTCHKMRLTYVSPHSHIHLYGRASTF